MSKISFIKENFAKNYKHEEGIAPDNRLVHNVFNGCGIHTRSGVKTLIRMLKPKFILEIGSYHFETANQMAYTFDELYGSDHSIGHIHSFDIKKGGYDGVLFNPGSSRITSHTWIPQKTAFDDWKYKDPEITSKCDYANITNEEIFERNLKYLKSITPASGFDMVYIDGDHSYKGAEYDLEYSLKVINPEAVIIIDDIWDHRLQQVRDFYNDLKNEKWDFVEWNTANRDKVQNMGVFLP